MRSFTTLAAAYSLATMFAVMAAFGLLLHAQQQAASPAAMPAEVQSKLDRLEANLRAARAADDGQATARALNQVGEFYLRLSAPAKALESYNQALTAARTARNVHEEEEALIGVGNCRRLEGENKPALEAFTQALNLATGAGDLRGQVEAMNGAGWVANNTGQNQKALEMLKRALELARIVGDPDLEATTLNRLGVVFDSLAENDKAFESYNQALPLWRAAGDQGGEGNTLNNLGVLNQESEDAPTALKYYQQALTLRRAVGDRVGEAATLNNIGVLYKRLGKIDEAIRYYQQALPVQRAAGNRAGEAAALNNIGNIYSATGEPRKALDSFEQALELRKASGDSAGEAGALNNIGQVYSQLGEKKKALEYLVQALALRRSAEDRRGEATTLNLIGVIFDDLGQVQEALKYYNQALETWHAIGDKNGEADELDNIAGTYSAPGEKQKALEYYSRALAVQRAVGDQIGEARTLHNIGLVYDDLGQEQEALKYYNQSLPIRRAIRDRAGESSTLINIGTVYDVLGEQQKAMEYYTQALALATVAGDPVLKAQIFYNLMLNRRAQQPALAVFYGKQAVNFVQQVRGNLQGLDKRLQTSFVATKASDYHDLADLLIALGRLPEAQQVLDLLKQQEYRDYVRGEAASTVTQLALTPAEKQAEADYEKSTAQIVSLGEQWNELSRNGARTAEQDKQYTQLSDQLDAAGKGLDKYYARLYVLFGAGSDANKQVGDVKAGVSALGQEIAEMPHTVALYTLVGKDRTSVIVITGSTEVARQIAISGEELNKKVATLEEALRDPATNPKPAAQELYKILIRPVKADLDEAQAETLVWSLDGVLRYVPMAALFDGKQYLIEKYNTVTITPASIPHLAEKPDVSGLSAAAMGISRKYEEGLPALPAVVGELNEIVTDAQVKGTKGALPGTILLDGQFTERAMEDQLRGQHQVVHIASHFVFKPGDDSQSYLLLAGKEESGSGFHLTVADFNSNRNLNLRRTDLLTLSACQTGMTGNASNGREVDGLGTTAQLKGAKAVISSLWEVDDASTGELMGDFYKRWADGRGKVAKVEALREAQLDLLLGRVKVEEGASGRGSTVEPQRSIPAGFAHPFYWAPFVLMGNWR
jgi:CHAT domain-containing protein/Tfp pilus assembly protein PilF